MASGWERRREDIERVSRPVREWMVQALDPQPGDTVLELAWQAPVVRAAAAAILGEQGRLISSDFSPETVEVARRRAAELRLANVEHRVMDAERMSLEDDSVDGVLCRFGFMLMSDPAAALAETRRVLRERGRLALAVREHRRRQPAGRDRRPTSPSGVSHQPEPGAPGMFVLADERGCEASRGGEFRRRASRAGARALRVRRRGRLRRANEGPGAACSRGSGAPRPTKTVGRSRRGSQRIRTVRRRRLRPGLPGVAVVAAAS